ncbi:MAG: lipopolysaccharide assembly protein LapA domain-containing protein [Planctomycetota bacterium]
MRKFQIALILIALVLVLIVVVQNSAAVTVHFLWFQPFDLSLVLLVLFVFLLGALTGFLGNSILQRRRHQQRRRESGDAGPEKGGERPPL